MIRSIPSADANPEWKLLYAAAVEETDRTKVPKRVADARIAILDRIADSIPNRLLTEQRELDAALRSLRTLSSE